MSFLGYSFKKDSTGSGRKLTYCVTETSTSETARHPMVTYVGVWSFLDTAIKPTVIEFPMNPMQNKTDAAITTYVFAIVLRVVQKHSFRVI